MAETWFQRDEYATLRKEVEDCMAELGTLERAVVGGVAALFAWAAKDGSSVPHLAAIVWLGPTVLAVYGGLKARAIRAHLDVLGGYLRQIEEFQLARDAGPAGWQEYFRHNSPGARSKLAIWAWLGFIVLTFSTGLVGFATSI